MGRAGGRRGDLGDALARLVVGDAIRRICTDMLISKRNSRKMGKGQHADDAASSSRVGAAPRHARPPVYYLAR